MIVKILSAPASFEGVSYNTTKVEKNKGKLLKVANFGPLQKLGAMRAEDLYASMLLVDIFTTSVRFGGLTTFGADVIKECNRLSIFVDLSHANGDAVIAALKSGITR
jgi:membrane dipeptidase